MSLVIWVLLLAAGGMQAQQYIFKGEIRDAESSEPVPFAHCQILPGGQTGFVADLNGNFSHRAEERELEVEVSAIGYESKRVKITAKGPNLIELQASSLSLSEVVVTYVDHERALLQKVLDAIPDNYPRQNERITGQVIEKLSTDSLYQNPIYVATATIEADKLPYSSRNKYSTVRILDGAVEFHLSMDSIVTNIAAGAHNVHRFDIVAARESPLNNIYAKRYRFRLVDTLSYQGSALFKMHFETPVYSGALYIQDSTYALVKAEYTANPEKLQTFNWSDGYHRLFLRFTTEYFKEDRFFRLSFINYQTGFSEIDGEFTDRVYLNNFFYLNRHAPAPKPIPFTDQTNFTNRLVRVLTTDTTAQVSISYLGADSKKLRRRLKTNSVLQRITMMSGLGLLRYRPGSGPAALRESGLDGQLLRRVNELVLALKMDYQFNNAWGVGYALGGSGGNDPNVSSHALLVTWNQPISRNRRWLIGISAGANYFRANLETGEGMPSDDLLQRTVLQAQTTQIEERTRQVNLLTGMQLKYRLDGPFFAVLSGYLPFNGYNKLQVEARQESERVLLFAREMRNRFRPDYYQLGLGFQLNF